MIVSLLKPDSDFLKKYIGDDPLTRPFHYVYLEREDQRDLKSKFNLVVTDGKALAISKRFLINGEKIEEGSYAMLKRKSKTVLCKEDPDKAGQFPRWKKVIPKKEEGFIKITDFIKSKGDNYTYFVCRIARIMSEESIPILLIQEDYYKGLPAGKYTLEIHKVNSSYYYHFYNDNFELVVVSITIDTSSIREGVKVYHANK